MYCKDFMWIKGGEEKTIQRKSSNPQKTQSNDGFEGAWANFLFAND